MLKKKELVMLPAEKAWAGGLFFYNFNHATAKNDTYLRKQLGSLDDRPATFQHLYIVSNEPIKEGDWIVCMDEIDPSVPNWRLSQAVFQFKGGNCKNDRKIIATTDLLPIGENPENTYYSYGGAYAEAMQKLKFLPSPSPSFVEAYAMEYNRGNKIKEVLVEYTIIEWSMHVDPTTVNQIALKINKRDLTITIKKIQSNWNREELQEIIAKVATDVRVNGFGGHSVSHAYAAWWIENNV